MFVGFWIENLKGRDQFGRQRLLSQFTIETGLNETRYKNEN
jgi:hypothetical protein